MCIVYEDCDAADAIIANVCARMIYNPRAYPRRGRSGKRETITFPNP